MNKIKMKPGYIFLFIIAFYTFSCHNTKKVNNKNLVDVEENNGLPESYKLIVSFYSPGNGIDHNMKMRFTTFLTTNYSEVEYETIKWGKEGEIDFCFQLNELNNDQKEKFIKDTKELLSSSNKVNIDENSQCRHKESP